MVNIRQNLLSSSLYSIKSPYTMKPTRIVVHNTANDASAANEVAYMLKNSNQVSFHYAVDDKEIVQGIPENRNAWHAGDGNGKGNREGIAIEICYSKGGGERFVQAEKNAVDLIVNILKRYGWGIDKVTKHQDYSGKYCPHRTLDMGWQRFIDMIKAELNGAVPATKPAAKETKIDAAQSFNKSKAGTYKTTANLHLRVGASTSKKSICVMPKNSLVTNYGYYTGVWYLVKYGDKTGFCSSNYLKRK